MPTEPKTVASTPEEYIASLPEDRKAPIEAVRKVIKDNLAEGIEEGIQYRMLGYFIPHSIFPAGYHCDPKQPLPMVHLASQKNYMSLYMFCIYGNEELREQFVNDSIADGKKVDMGAGCIRFKKLEDLSQTAVENVLKKITVQGFIDRYTAMIPPKKTKATKEKAPKEA